MARLSVKVQPKASRDRMEVTSTQVRIWVTAPPTDGQANRAVELVLAKSFRVAPGRVRVVRGETARQKWVEIEGVSDAEISEWLSQNPENPAE